MYLYNFSIMKKTITIIFILYPILVNAQSYIANYPFSGNANDSSSNNYDGVVYGATLTEDRIMTSNSAYQFDGSNDRIDIGTLPLLSLQTFSFSFWIKSDLTHVTQIEHFTGVLNDGTTTNLGVALHFSSNVGYNPGYMNVFIRDESGKVFSFHSDLTSYFDNNWHCITVVIPSASSNSGFLYVDGNVMTTTTTHSNSPVSFNSFQYPFQIGAFNNRGTIQDYYYGKLDDVKFYDFALTSIQVSQNCEMTLNSEEVEFIKGVILYPNPTDDKLQISILDNSIKSFDVYNNNGEKMFSNKLQQGFLDISDWAPGIYMVIFYNDVQTIKRAQKVVVY